MTPLYLSQLVLAPRQRNVQHDLADCCAMHQRVLQGFPDDPVITAARQQFGVLYRVEVGDGPPVVLVQSVEEPDWSRLPAGYFAQPVRVKRIEHVYAKLEAGWELQFRLCANPTKALRKTEGTPPSQQRGRRVALFRVEDCLAWLQRKSQANGFNLLAVRRSPLIADLDTRPVDMVHGKRSDQSLVTLGVAQFEGRLRITDSVLFQTALIQGIGHGKAYGCGLLTLAPG